MLAKERGYRDIIITGIRGTCTDHLLGNLFLLAKSRFASLRIKIIDGREEMVIARKHTRIKGKKGDVVSLVALRSARGVATKGLFYPLHGAVLQQGSARGIRNRLTGTYAEVGLRNGALLVIHQHS